MVKIEISVKIENSIVIGFSNGESNYILFSINNFKKRLFKRLVTEKLDNNYITRRKIKPSYSDYSLIYEVQDSKNLNIQIENNNIEFKTGSDYNDSFKLNLNKKSVINFGDDFWKLFYPEVDKFPPIYYLRKEISLIKSAKFLEELSKKKREKIDNHIFGDIMKELEYTAKNGKSNISISKKNITQATLDRLTNLGYSINVDENTTDSYGYYINISWEEKKEEN